MDMKHIFSVEGLSLKAKFLQHSNSSVLSNAWQNNPVEAVYMLLCFMILKDARHELAHDATSDMHELIATAYACIS